VSTPEASLSCPGCKNGPPRLAERLVLGLDEAGRGPVLGPMVLAAVVLDSRGEAELVRLGVRDSKTYGSTQRGRELRSKLAAVIRQVALHVGERVVDVASIDRAVAHATLNVLERECASELIRAAPRVERIVCDGKAVFGSLAAMHPNLQALDDADATHVAVAAASVVAKARRDELFGAIAARYAAEYGELRGGGYPNKHTQAFLIAYARRTGRLPPEARRSWPHEYLRPYLRDECRFGTSHGSR